MVKVAMAVPNIPTIMLIAYNQFDLKSSKPAVQKMGSGNIHTAQALAAKTQVEFFERDEYRLI